MIHRTLPAVARSKTAKTTAKKLTKPTAKAKPTAAKSATKPAGGPTAGLDGVAKALTRGDAAAALTTALDAWRAARAPALADLIDLLSNRIAFPPIQDDLAWTKVAITKDPLALGRLLSVIGDLPVSFLPNAVVKLAAFPDDPRIGSAALGWIVDPPTQSTSTYPFWTQLYKLLERLGDTRVISAIDERLALPMEASKQFPKAKVKKPSQFWGKFYGALGKTREQLAASPVATVDKAALAKLSKQAAKLEMTTSKATPAVTGGKQVSKAEAGAPLDRALAHATAKRVPEAIDALLEAWRRMRVPELADLIDRATRLLPTFRETLPVEPKPAHAAWQAAFDRDPVGELPRLVRHVHVGGAALATEHVVALSTLPDDPRIAYRLAELAVNTNISPERGQYWKSTWELIARTRDTRVIGPLRQDFDDFSGTYYDHHRSGKRLLADFVLAEPPPLPLHASDHKAINQITAALDAIVPDHIAQERALLADICAHWDDEAPRLVYADWLIERENLRGQLIVLSCKLAREKQLSKSEAKQLKALRGGFRTPTYLFGVLSDFKHAIDRGLPAQLDVTWNESPISMKHLAGDLLLPCVDVIKFDTHDMRGRPSAADLARVMLDPTATRLVRVDNVPNELQGSRAADPRFQIPGSSSRLADELEPLVKAGWKRDGRNFLRR